MRFQRGCREAPASCTSVAALEDAWPLTPRPVLSCPSGARDGALPELVRSSPSRRRAGLSPAASDAFSSSGPQGIETPPTEEVFLGAFQFQPENIIQMFPLQVPERLAVCSCTQGSPSSTTLGSAQSLLPHLEDVQGQPWTKGRCIQPLEGLHVL
jgi:hypothetical protein